MRRISVALVALGFSVGPRQHHDAPLIVHEWGTITTRHAPDGTPQGRLNRISPSEVLPAFVHQYEPPPTQNDPQKALTKSPVTPGRPDVTMRLETPVIYFYPAAGSVPLPPFDVSVKFRGGIVNEFYPEAEPSVALDVERISAKMRAGVINSWNGSVLDNYVIGGLRWKGISLQETASLPSTSSHLWLAPRKVRSAIVRTSSREAERYLFYRGVAHLDALVQTELSPTEVRLRAPERLLWLRKSSMTIPKLWLVDIRADGAVAFREQEQITIEKTAAAHALGAMPLFSAKDHTPGRLGDLRRSMKQMLIARGLFEDEAEAMLETWKESYFATPGLRILYIVPNEWIAYFLPLQISPPHMLTRVLVGRIDLQRTSSPRS
jgi:hypothetical protein